MTYISTSLDDFFMLGVRRKCVISRHFIGDKKFDVQVVPKSLLKIRWQAGP
jgi:hypothetical protein